MNLIDKLVEFSFDPEFIAVIIAIVLALVVDAIIIKHIVKITADYEITFLKSLLLCFTNSAATVILIALSVYLLEKSGVSGNSRIVLMTTLIFSFLPGTFVFAELCLRKKPLMLRYFLALVLSISANTIFSFIVGTFLVISFIYVINNAFRF